MKSWAIDMTRTSQPARQTRGSHSGDQPDAPADLHPVSVWEMPERGTRGPKPRHDRAEIASAGSPPNSAWPR
jgi:hypothetical protein